MQRTLLDPTSEQRSVQRQRVVRPQSLLGKTVGLLDISKGRGDIFLNQLELRLQEHGVSTRRYRKPTYARVAPTALKQSIAAECDLVIEALAD